MRMEGGRGTAEQRREPVAAGSRPPDREARPHGRLYAALDLGTNNCRLLIARPVADGFHVVDAFSRVVRLGERLGQTGLISEGAQQRAIDALKICAAKLKRRDITMFRSVATEACRRAGNGAAFVERVYRETGIVLDVITTAEEARLAVLGCQGLIDRDGGDAIVFDIGGGSTEIVLVRPKPTGDPETIAWTSNPVGVVSLAEMETVGEALAPGDASLDARLQAYARMRSTMDAALASFSNRVRELRDGARLQLLGTSGTITTLAAIHLGLASYDRRLVDGCLVPTDSLRRIASALSAATIQERARMPSIGPDRADLIVAGCAILDSILDHWPVDHLRVADRGIREGVLRTLVGRGRDRA